MQDIIRCADYSDSAVFPTGGRHRSRRRDRELRERLVEREFFEAREL
jgi:hypothetical protein